MTRERPVSSVEAALLRRRYAHLRQVKKGRQCRSRLEPLDATADSAGIGAIAILPAAKMLSDLTVESSAKERTDQATIALEESAAESRRSEREATKRLISVIRTGAVSPCFFDEWTSSWNRLDEVNVPDILMIGRKKRRVVNPWACNLQLPLPLRRVQAHFEPMIHSQSPCALSMDCAL